MDGRSGFRPVQDGAQYRLPKAIHGSAATRGGAPLPATRRSDVDAQGDGQVVHGTLALTSFLAILDTPRRRSSSVHVNSSSPVSRRDGLIRPASLRWLQI